MEMTNTNKSSIIIIFSMSMNQNEGKRYFREGLRPLSNEDLEKAMSQNLDEINDFSAGCIVFREGDCHVLLLKNKQIDKYWCFPKGHPDDSDSSVVAAAIRETVEETGVRPTAVYEEDKKDVGYSMIKKLHNDRWFKHPAYPDESKRPILVQHKVVRYYLATTSVESAQAFCADGTDEAYAGKQTLSRGHILYFTSCILYREKSTPRLRFIQTIQATKLSFLQGLAPCSLPIMPTNYTY